ncbi:MAG: hypothetical protein ACI4SV_01095 [Duodenibacillus sp.]
MPTKMDIAGMENKYMGHVFHGCTVKQFLERIERPCGTTDWQVRAQCVCGRLFECRFSTLRRYEKPSCGCRRRGNSTKGKEAGNRIYSPDEKIKQHVAEQKAKDEAAKASPKKRRTETSVLAAIGLSEARLTKLWETLDHGFCCPAWKNGPEKFVAWALRNGWARGRELVRLDENMPWHPLNVRWETMA